MPPIHSYDGGGDDGDDDQVFTSLVDHSSRSNEREGARGQLQQVNRILIIVLLVLLVTVSVFFETQQIHLAQQLQNDETTISQLLSTVESQGKVIARFNESVTNSDVVARLNKLDKRMTASQEALEEKLDVTVQDVNEKLDETLKKLDDTVATAEKQIGEQVETVKKDFEQYVVRTEDQFSMENSFMVYQLAGTFTLLSCLISMWHMTAHLRKMKQPVIQRKILAILWMSPIYAITSWFSLVFPNAEGYLAIIKDAYESYIIYQVSSCESEKSGSNRPSFYAFKGLTPTDIMTALVVSILLYCRLGKRRSRCRGRFAGTTRRPFDSTLSALFLLQAGSLRK